MSSTLWPRLAISIVRPKVQTTVPSWLVPIVFTETRPAPGRDFDSRLSVTSELAYSVSPAYSGWTSLMSLQPRFAIAFWLTSVTLMPTISATVNGLQTMQRLNSLAFAYSASKCIGWVFIVSSVNQVLSVSEIVRPGRCS